MTGKGAAFDTVLSLRQPVSESSILNISIEQAQKDHSSIQKIPVKDLEGFCGVFRVHEFWP